MPIVARLPIRHKPACELAQACMRTCGENLDWQSCGRSTTPLAGRQSGGTLGSLEIPCDPQGNLVQLWRIMSQTIYARVPDTIKDAADAHAAANGVTLASAVSELLDRGLQAVADERSIGELERSAAELMVEVEALRQRDHAVSSAYQALAQRVAQPVGACQRCGDPVTGHDLLVAGRCPKPDCAASLTELLSRPPAAGGGKGGLDDGEFKMLLGALGLALGIAYLSQHAGAAGGG